MTLLAAKDTRGGQLDVVQICWQYGVLSTNAQVGLPLLRPDRRNLAGLVRLLEGDPRGRRRRHRRLPLMLPVRLVTPQGEVDAVALNISGGGVHVIGAALIPAGSAVTVTFDDGGAGDRSFQGTVAWVRPRGIQFGMGVRFSSFPLMQHASVGLDAPEALAAGL